MGHSNNSVTKLSDNDNVHVISSRQYFSQLKENWNSVYDSDDEAHIFLSWEWLNQLYARREESVFILAFKSSPNSDFFSAFLPLRKGVGFDPDNGVMLNTISLAGNNWADYAGVLCDSRYDMSAIPALGDALRKCSWGKLSLSCLKISQRRRELLGKSFPDDSFKVKPVASNDNNGAIDLSVCPGVELPDTYNEYLETCVRPKTRQKIRRYERKLNAQSTLGIKYSTADTLESDLDQFAHLWCQRYRAIKGIGVYRKATIYRTILSQGFHSGLMQILVLSERDEPVAIQANYIDQNKNQLLFYVTARSEKFRTVPAGLLLHTQSIKFAINSGLRYYDMLRGDEKYKYSLGGENHYLLNLRIKRRKWDASKAFLDDDCTTQALKLTRTLTQRLSTSRIERLYSQMLESWPNSPTVLKQYSQWLAQSGMSHHAELIQQHLRTTGQIRSPKVS